MIGLRWPRPALAERVAAPGRGDDGGRPARRGRAVARRRAVADGRPGARLQGADRAPRRAGRPSTRPSTRSSCGPASSPCARSGGSVATPAYAGSTSTATRWPRRSRRWSTHSPANPPDQRMTTLTKHHGLGNDFLVVFHPARRRPPGVRPAAVRPHDAASAPTACSSARASPGYAARMVLFNADGSRAEMSGNGIRCFAQALAARRGDLTPQTILTDAGPRRVELLADRGPAHAAGHRRHGCGARAGRARRVGRHRCQPGPTRGPPRPRQPAHRRRRRRRRRRRPPGARPAGAPGQPRDHRARAGAGRHHDARPRARRRHHPGLRHGCRGRRVGRRPLGSRQRRRRGTGGAHGRRQRESGAPPARTRTRHPDRPGHVRRHDRGTTIHEQPVPRGARRHPHRAVRPRAHRARRRHVPRLRRRDHRGQPRRAVGADRHRRRRRGRPDGAAPRPPRPHLVHRQGQGRRAARAVPRGRRRHGRVRQRAQPGPAVQPGEAARPHGASTAPP